MKVVVDCSVGRKLKKMKKSFFLLKGGEKNIGMVRARRAPSHHVPKDLEDDFKPGLTSSVLGDRIIWKFNSETAIYRKGD